MYGIVYHILSHNAICSFTGDEIFHDNLKEIIEAVHENAEVSHKLAHGILVGPTGSGKSSLMDRLLNRPRKKFSSSTGVSEPVVVVKVVNSDTFHPVTVMDENTWEETEYDNSLLRQMDEGVVTSHSGDTTTSSPPAKKAKIKSDTRPDPISSPQQSLYKVVKHFVVRLLSFLMALTQKLLLRTNTEKTNPTSPTPTTIVVEPPSEEIVQRVIKRFDGYNNFERFLKSISLYLRDTGGQVEFQEMLPLLVIGPCIVFFVFRLDLDFKDKFKVTYRKSTGEIVNDYISSITTEEAFLQCLATVDAMGMSGEASVKTHQPFVFVIGTHRDKLGSLADKKIAELNAHLGSLIGESGFRDLVQYADWHKRHVMFTVDNTSEDDQDFKQIRSKVSIMIRDRKEFTIRFPIRYLLFCLELQNSRKSVLSLSECKDMAAKCGIDEDQLVHLLQFLHLRIGVILYFDKNGVKHIVIKEPQVLFNNITNLIIRTFSYKALLTAEVEDFEKKGILTASVLAVALKDLGNITPKDFLELLVHLRIAAPFRTSEKRGKEKRYFFPCILNHVTESTVDPSTEILPLAVKLKCGYCPKGLFSVLVTHLMTSHLSEVVTCYATTFKLRKKEIFKDQVSFKVCSSHGIQDKLTLKVHLSYLEIRFFPDHFEGRQNTSITAVCNNIRQIVETCIHQSLQDLHYKKDIVAPKTCLRCNDCSKLHRVVVGSTIRYKKACTPAKSVPDEGKWWFREGKYQVSICLTHAAPEVVRKLFINFNQAPTYRNRHQLSCWWWIIIEITMHQL